MISIPFADRTPTLAEVERLRLILSTYQDGSGMLSQSTGTLPGWRDFERAVATVFNGESLENKSIFDVVVSAPRSENRPKYGISCKMRRELDRVNRDGRVTIEVSNAAGEFWDAIKAAGVKEHELERGASTAGIALRSVVQGWLANVSHETGGGIDISKSCYLVLLWNRTGEYQLFQFPLNIWNPDQLQWTALGSGRRLCGHDGIGNLIEWYFASGGQLKLYPLAASATWCSERFRLEPLPPKNASLVGKAKKYFPEKWSAALR